MREKMMKTSLFISVFAMILASCSVKDDADAIAALRHVTLEYDSLTVNFDFPEGAGSGQPFSELLEENSELYGNPANYSIVFIGHYTAINESESARDAKFDGIMQDLIFNNYSDFPVQMLTPAFEIKKDARLDVETNGVINLETHRLPGKYIFEQTVAGEDLDTRILTDLMYKIGMQEGSITLPAIQRDIPTRASDNMKSFLQGLLESGILDE